jgi:hypothetical protein
MPSIGGGVVGVGDGVRLGRRVGVADRVGVEDGVGLGVRVAVGEMVGVIEGCSEGAAAGGVGVISDMAAACRFEQPEKMSATTRNTRSSKCVGLNGISIPVNPPFWRLL